MRKWLRYNLRLLVALILGVSLWLSPIGGGVSVTPGGSLLVTPGIALAHPAPPAYQNISETKVTSATEITMPADGTASDGDLMIAWVTKDDDTPIYLPTGDTWTLIQARPDGDNKGVYVSVSYRIFQTGDTEWTWTGDSEGYYGVIIRYTGHDPSTPIAVSANATGTDTAPIAPSVNTTRADNIVLYMFGADDNDVPYTVPGTLNSRWNDSVSTTGGAGGDKTVAAQGASGAETFGMSSTEEWVAVTVAIQPPIVATPDISNTPTGKAFGVVNASSSYWSSGSEPSFPLDNVECFFNVTNSSGAAVDITINATDFVGGDGWVLVPSSPGSGEVLLKAGKFGDATEGSMVTLNGTAKAFMSNLADSASRRWEVKIETGTFTDGVLKETTITLTASLS